MKTLRLLIPIFSLILFSCEEKHNLVAELDGVESDTIFVRYGTVSDYFTGDRPKRDTIYAKNGKFVYDIPSQDPYIVYFIPKDNVFKRLDGDPYYSIQNSIVTLIEPNDNIKVTGKLNTYYVNYKAKGSIFNEEYSALRNTYIQESSKAVKLELKIDSLLFNNNANSEQINKLFKERNKFNRLQNKAEIKYIEDNPRKNISALFLTRRNSKTFYKYYSNLPTEVKNGIFKIALDEKIKRIKKFEKIDDARKKIIAGASAPNFSLLSLSGENIELMSIKDKYVVLDFWGSWCPPCVKGFPKMKEYYSKYKDEVEFIGIACNETDKKWKETVNKFNLEWVQLINNDTLLEKDVSVKYGIQSYPTKIILNKEKIIVGIFTGETDEFYIKLDSILR